MTGDQIASLAPRLSALLVKFRHCFERESTVKHWETYLLGLMAHLDRKSIEPIALAADKSPRTSTSPSSASFVGVPLPSGPARGSVHLDAYSSVR